MTTLVNDPQAFASDSLAGFLAAHPERIAGVPGGLLRRDLPQGRVAIVTGGGSGHFPAFAGWVGAGLLDAAVCGNVFSSPSEREVLSVTRAADRGAGVLFLPINYTGDILHFGAARDDLVAEGVDARLVVVTDDIASADAEHAELRRGVAGALIVMKAVGAAAERGLGLDALEEIARAANAATRSFGVAFRGCTLPGADRPLFELAQGRMGVGLGIHGEPGIDEVAVGAADEVADLLVDGLFAERAPIAGQAVAVVVNGLGGTKYDELNLVFSRVRSRIESAGMRLVAPVVGEYMTSLDMAGLSVSLGYLTPELEELWRDAVDAPAWSRPRIDEDAATAETFVASEAAEAARVEPGSPASQAAARQALDAAERALDALLTAQEELGALDAVIGDGDHGVGMVRGAGAAVAAIRAAVDAGAGLGTALDRAGDAWSSVAGGTSGALWGAGLQHAGARLGDGDAPSPELVRDAVEAFSAALLQRGGAAIGDKTMVDAVVPFSERFAAETEAGADTRTAWDAAAGASTAAARATSALPSRRGRSRIYGERSIGTADPGAVSFALIVDALRG